MFIEMRFSNFKGFADSHSIPLNKINIFYGANSAGKSAILEALLLMRQSIRRPSLTQDIAMEPFLFNGSHVDLGSFQAAVNGHNLSKKISMGVSYQVGQVEDEEDEYDDLDSQHFDVEVAWDHQQKTPVLERCIYRVDVMPENTIHFKKFKSRNDNYVLKPVREEGFSNVAKLVAEGSTNRLVESQEMEVDTEEIMLSAEYENWSFLPGMPPIESRTPTSTSTIFAEHMNGNDESEIESKFEISEKEALLRVLLEDLTLRSWRSMLEGRFRETSQHLATIRYLGPMRKSPTRVERLSDKSTSYVGREGEGVGSILHRNPGIVTTVNRYLRNLSIPYELHVRKLDTDVFGTSGEIIAIQLVDLRSNVILSLEDVGFGISQVLPLIVQLALSKSDLILIEQPELHLHPAIQANFADLLIEGANKENPNQFMIETHSEHLMLRIQRRIRDGLISNKDVNVFYVDSTENSGSYVLQLELDERGEFVSSWPNGFFPERLDELLG